MLNVLLTIIIINISSNITIGVHYRQTISTMLRLDPLITLKRTFQSSNLTYCGINSVAWIRDINMLVQRGLTVFREMTPLSLKFEQTPLYYNNPCLSVSTGLLSALFHSSLDDSFIFLSSFALLFLKSSSLLLSILLLSTSPSSTLSFCLSVCHALLILFICCISCFEVWSVPETKSQDVKKIVSCKFANFIETRY